MPAELSGVICGGIVLLPHVYVTCMCVYVNVVACSEKLLLLLLLKKNWRAAGLELTTRAPSRTIVTDGNC